MDPHRPASSTPRRRSSIAYDPARDTFTVIPDTTVEVEDAVSNGSTGEASSPVQVKQAQPKTTRTPAEPRVTTTPLARAEIVRMSSPPHESRKRDRSSSPAQKRSTQNGHRGSEPPYKRQRSIENETTATATRKTGGQAQNGHVTAARQPRIPKVNREEGERRPQQGRTLAAFRDRRPDTNQNTQRRRPDDERPRDYDRVRDRPRRSSRSPGGRVPQAYRRRSPPRPQKRDPSRSPSPIRDSPPRDLPRPGGGRGRGRNVLAEQERLRAERERAAGILPITRGVQGVVNQWYNAVPEYVKERGRDWRKNESQIKGLRSFNNWVKSCIIQKFSPQDKPAAAADEGELGWGEEAKEPEEIKPLLVLDIGCGKGGDLGKWDKAPQSVGLYVGLDPAELSVEQASDRYKTMWKGRRPRFDGRFAVKDCFGEWIGDVPVVKEVGIDPNPSTMNRWGKGGGFDVVTMMFSMHYSFESQEKVEMMLRNVAGSLKKGGRFVGVCPNSDVLSEKVKAWFQKPTNAEKYKAAYEKANPKTLQDGQEPPETNGTTTTTDLGPDPSTDLAPSWSNSIYSVRFPPPTSCLPPLAADGSFRPPFGHKYTYFIAEAVDVPEFVVPWEAFRAIAENYGLEQRYRKGFLDIWGCETDPARATNTGAISKSSGDWGEEEEKMGGDDGVAKTARELEMLGVRMGVVRERGGELCMTEEEKEAVGFYHGFCFVKT